MAPRRPYTIVSARPPSTLLYMQVRRCLSAARSATPSGDDDAAATRRGADVVDAPAPRGGGPEEEPAALWLKAAAARRRDDESEHPIFRGVCGGVRRLTPCVVLGGAGFAMFFACDLPATCSIPHNVRFLCARPITTPPPSLPIYISARGGQGRFRAPGRAASSRAGEAGRRAVACRRAPRRWGTGAVAPERNRPASAGGRAARRWPGRALDECGAAPRGESSASRNSSGPTTFSQGFAVTRRARAACVRWPLPQGGRSRLVMHPRYHARDALAVCRTHCGVCPAYRQGEAPKLSRSRVRGGEWPG